MKVFNQIPAEMSGTIVEVLVENGDPVEFGQPLFRIE
jgi:acetyl-CoA carboxylase biotin carboxyl carrier protein